MRQNLLNPRALRTALRGLALSLSWALAPMGHGAPATEAPDAQLLAQQAVLADDIYASAPNGESRFTALHPGFQLITDPGVSLLMAWRYEAERRHLSLVFRGTVNAANWMDDLRQGLQGASAEPGSAPTDNGWMARSREGLTGGVRAGGPGQGIYPRSRQLIEQLLREQGLRPASVSLAGHSLGGGLAQYNALFFPGLATVYGFNPAALNVRSVAQAGSSPEQAAQANPHWLYSTRYHGAGCGDRRGAQRDAALPCLVLDDVVSSLSQQSRRLSDSESVQLGPLHSVDVFEVEDAWPLGLRVGEAQREAVKPVILLALGRPAEHRAETPTPSNTAHPGLGRLLQATRQAAQSFKDGQQEAQQTYQNQIRPRGTDLLMLYTRPAHSMRLLRARLCREAPGAHCPAPSNEALSRP
jgi:hypothetical protein